MKRYFITGLVILLPLALTLAVVTFVVNILTEPFVGMVKAILVYFDVFETGFLFLSPDQLQRFLSQLIILVLLFFLTVGLGWLARLFFFHYIIRLWESTVHRIPFIRGVYKASKEVIQTIFTSNGRSFKQVVIVPFPNAETLSIGFLTRENVPLADEKSSPLIAVFVPTTPNPTSGFLMLFKQTDLTYLDMKVEDALKFIISCGMVAAPIREISKEEAQNRSEAKG